MESTQDKGLVLVTGVTGFLGSTTAKICLERGYKVRGTVRSLQNQAKIQPLDKLPHRQNLELVEADLLDKDCWDKIVTGCDYVLHTASPFPHNNPKKEDDVILPAVNGTLNVVRACSNHTDTIKHVVVTSSTAAIQNVGKYDKPELTEEDWGIPEALSPYPKSKTLAEKALWEFYKNQDPTKKFRISVINPGYILGPSLVSTDFTSGYIIIQVMMKKIQGLPKIAFPIIDVRDVALAHILAFEKGEVSDGQRYICANGNLWFHEISQLLVNEFKKYGYKIQTKKIPFCTAKMASIFRKDVKAILPFWNASPICRNDKIKRDLGIEFIPKEEALIKMAYSLIENGLLPDKITNFQGKK